jgi:hypothetical protein
VSELNRIHIHAQCANWSAGISYPHSRACPLIGSFTLGFTYCDGRERESDRNITFRCSSIGYFFPGFHIVSYRELSFMFDYDTKEKEHQNTLQSYKYSGTTPPRTNQIASCFDALSITYLMKIRVTSVQYYLPSNRYDKITLSYCCYSMMSLRRETHCLLIKGSY